MTDKKTALITGASSGIGKAIYEMLIADGWTVYGTSRKAQPGEATLKDNGYMLYMDVTDEESVAEAMGIIAHREGGLDALINNAGTGIAGSVEDTSVEEAKELFDTLFFGSLRTVRAAFELLSKRRGMIVNISSVAGVLSIPFQGMYSAGKAALEAASEALRMEAGPYGVRVCIIEPGDTKTEFTANRTYAKAAKGSKYEAVMKKSVAKMEHDEQNGAPPQAVAKLVRKVLGKKRPPVRRAVGFSYQILVFLKRLLPDRLILWILEKMYA